MKDKLIQFYKSNTDAVATNRGFYYQYLVLLKEWLILYTNGSSEVLFTEVDDDIKKVGEELTFTQVKCYTSSFSFQSREIQKTIFNYFILFLQNENNVPVNFCFCTNTSLAPNEKLLSAWRDDPELKDVTLKRAVLNKIGAILKDEFKLRRRKKLENSKLKEDDKHYVSESLKTYESIVSNELLETFVSRIKWVFNELNPEAAIEVVWKDIRELLNSSSFNGKPTKLLERALLSEIYKRSQLEVKEDRILDAQTIDNLVSLATEEMESVVDNKLLDLLEVRINEVEERYRSAFDDYTISVDRRIETIRDEVKNKTPTTPKILNSLPVFYNEQFIEREGVFEAIDSSSIITVSGGAGEGKSILVKEYLKRNQDIFNHILWINSTPSLFTSLLLNPAIQRNLNVSFDGIHTNEDKVKLICNELQRLEGNNLLVIDDFDGDIATLNLLTTLVGWKIVITYRGVIEGVKFIKTPKLNSEQLRIIYQEGLGREEKDSSLEDFFRFIEYNPLIAKMFAKTIANGIGVSLGGLLGQIKTQKLDEVKLDLTIPDSELPVQLLSYLQSKFITQNLTKEERGLMHFISLLPSDEIYIEDLARIGGEEYYIENLNHFINFTNSLHRKGWLIRENNTIKCYNMLQEFMVYTERESQNPFVYCSYLIVWLTRRIDENAQGDPSLSFKFLRYAESILAKIKEPYRRSLYQPLLVLENAVLYTYNWTDNRIGLHDRWLDLIQRAENHMNPNDVKLGIIYNNVGHSYELEGDTTNSIVYLKRAVNILKNVENKELCINAMNNLTQLHLILEDFDNAKKSLDETDKFLKKTGISISPFVALYYYLESEYYLMLKVIEHSESVLKKSISIFEKLEKEDQNKFYLYTYYAKLCYLLFIQFKDDELDKCLKITESIKTELGAVNGKIMEEVDELLNSIIEIKRN